MNATFWVKGHLSKGDPVILYWYEKNNSTFVYADFPWVCFL